MKLFAKLGLTGVLFVSFVTFITFLIFKPFIIISPGERGVLLVWGELNETPFGEGFHWLNPVSSTMDVIDVKTQKYETPTESASNDMQKVKTDVTINYNVNPTKVVQLRREVGFDDYEFVVIKPAVQEAIKAAVAMFDAEDLIQQRNKVSDLVYEYLSKTLDKVHITVTEISIEDFRFSEEFDKSIEAKVTAEQEALREKNILETIKYKAQQKEAEAQGKKKATILAAEAKNKEKILDAQANAEATLLAANAEAKAIKLKAEALSNNPQILDLIDKEIEKEKATRWSGTLPTNIYASAPIPFLDLTKK